MADREAKKAANLAVNTSTNNLSITTVKGLIKKHIKEKWKRMEHFRNRKESSHSHNYIPKVNLKRYLSTHNRKIESTYLRLIAGHSRLKDHMHLLKLSETPCCDCGPFRETPDHVLMDCTKYISHRDNMLSDIESTYTVHNTPPWERTVNTTTFLFPSHTAKETRAAVRHHVLSFLGRARIDM